MRWVLKLSLLILCFYGAARFCKKQTGSFTIARITSNLTFHPEWQTSVENEAEVRKLLSQPYYFLDKGAQSFVFVSHDQTTVIKFFRHHHLKKTSKLHKDFGSYKLAFERLRDETGLLYLHLNKTSHLNQTLDLVDKIGIHHPIDLDKYEFLVQKKAILTYTALDQWIREGKMEEAKIALSNLLRLLALRAERGLLDKDPDLNSNFGFLGLKPVQIDIGRFKIREASFDPKELTRITDNLHQWLMVKAPELDEHLREEIKKYET